MPKDTGDFVLEGNRKASMDIDARLGIVPAATATVHKSASFCATIIRILGIEDIIDLAHEANIGPLAIGYW